VGSAHNSSADLNPNLKAEVSSGDISSGDIGSAAPGENNSDVAVRPSSALGARSKPVLVDLEFCKAVNKHVHRSIAGKNRVVAETVPNESGSASARTNEHNAAGLDDSSTSATSPKFHPPSLPSPRASIRLMEVLQPHLKAREYEYLALAILAAHPSPSQVELLGYTGYTSMDGTGKEIARTRLGTPSDKNTLGSGGNGTTSTTTTTSHSATQKFALLAGTDLLRWAAVARNVHEGRDGVGGSSAAVAAKRTASSQKTTYAKDQDDPIQDDPEVRTTTTSNQISSSLEKFLSVCGKDFFKRRVATSEIFRLGETMSSFCYSKALVDYVVEIVEARTLEYSVDDLLRIVSMFANPDAKEQPYIMTLVSLQFRERER
jgi:hypothetical protein